MQSRVEDILEAAVEGTDLPEGFVPQSRVEVLLVELLNKLNGEETDPNET